MSLKAKIEAVIYASEEPVTLAQLIGLLGEEGQFELDEFNANQLSLDTPTDDEDILNAEVLDPSDIEPEEEAVPVEVILSEGSVATEPGPPSSATALSSPKVVSDPTDPAAPDAKALAVAAKLKDRKLREYFRSLLDQLIADYANGDRGLEVREVASGYRLATKPEYHDAVRGFVKSLKPPIKLTLQALETLAVIAYKQPVTAPEISEIRGVDSAGVLGSLMARKLVTTAGRKQVIGRPILYKTTKDFLLRFGLKDIAELPSIEEFEKMAGELNETLLDQVSESETQEEAPMEDTPNESAPVGTPDDQPTSAPIAEIDSAPEPTNTLHDTPEDLLSDKSYRPEGHNREHTDRTEVEPQAEPQADGIPEE